MFRVNKVHGLFAVLLLAALACNAPATAVQPTEPPATDWPAPATEVEAESVLITHSLTPPQEVPAGAGVIDVESSGTGPEKRAPYGDSYDINLLERPFLQDMTYVPDLDIASFAVSQDEVWYYVSIKLIGTDPNNPIGIDYAVELDTDKDGFGDFIIWAQPPYAAEWTTVNEKVFEDRNQDTSGVSSVKSDAPFSSDGYETPVFDGEEGMGADPDLAWVRTGNGGNANIQFAFKRAWAGGVFMAGVLADAGLKDVAQIDYVDQFSEQAAGSSVKDKEFYPLQALYSVDNTCRAAVGFAATGYEPMSCNKNVPATQPGNGNSGPVAMCEDPAYSESSCSAQGLYYWPPPDCACSTTPYNP